MQRLATIQALRAFAANMVVLSHLIGLQALKDTAFAPLDFWTRYFGSSGVQCFFIISGYVVARVAQRENWREFLISRVSRIYPVYWVYLGLFVLFLNSKGTPPSFTETAGAIGLLPNHNILPVSWSLVYEVYFYVVILAIIAVRSPMLPSLIAWALLSVMTTSTFSVLFISGALLTFLPRRMPLLALSLGVVLVPAGLIITAIYSVSAEIPVFFILGAPYILVIYGLTGVENNAHFRVPKILLKLGDASYSTYLGHFLLLAAIGRLYASFAPHETWQNILFVITSFTAVNLVGLVSYRLIESPIINWTRSLRTSEAAQERSLEI
jgi:exopolysaccharide production protein ExoZ